ncbi:nucleotidyl transferase AbiEii/AbiGii toxin family protein [Nocardia sp. NPDC050712]|uniref:nucleotidyl transferase AbiEii/AbiGii toxin family protein n=1 Tax=Nocardia sp. NPDC050712 TaxID=3155518 RepID=UPI0033F626CA
MTEDRLIPESTEHWSAEQREAVDHVLATIADSVWAKRLVLRGSTLLKAWFAEKARDPKDLDFVVGPWARWRFDDDEFACMARDIATGAAARSTAQVQISPVPMDFDAVEHIWTYDGTPGRRLLLPWECPARGTSGQVQLDFAVDEELAEPPQRTEIPRFGTVGPASTLLTVTPSLSLAWKLLWLASDTIADLPQGKDLYDAVLLAEHCQLPPTVLHAVLSVNDFWYPGSNTRLDLLLGMAQGVDWEAFAIGYPLLEDAHEEFVWRLLVAVAATFPPGLGDLHRRLVSEQAGWIQVLRERYADDPLAGAEEEFACHPTWVLEQLIVVHELLGPTSSLHEAAEVVAAMQRRRAPDDLFGYRGFADPHRMASDLTAAR